MAAPVTLIEADPAHIRARMLRAASLRKAERTAEASFHGGIAVRMIKSILDTGDGRTPGSAFTVYRVQEEYEVAKMLGAEVESQALITRGNRSFDMLTLREAKTQRTARIFFDVTEILMEEQRAFGFRQADNRV